MVLGPNGFHRHFTGDVIAEKHRAPEPEIRIEYDQRREGLRPRLLNHGDERCAFRLVANAYHHHFEPVSLRVGPHDDHDHFLSLKHSASWYDFTVTVVGVAAFSRRFAGHMETGRHSLRDPGLGGRARGEQT